MAEFDRLGRERIVYPATPEGEQRNPVLWPRRFLPDLRARSGGAGAKALLQAHAAESVAVTVDPALLADVDTPADLHRAAMHLEAAPAQSEA